MLKNKIAELKERLNQIYSQSAVDATRSKAFESEFSLYLKACELARNERTEGMRLQRDVTKFGLALLTVGLTFTVYVFNVHIFLSTLILLGFGFISCGFMYLLLAGELQIQRAGEYCNELEAYFKDHRWSAEIYEALNLARIPLWEEYRSKWDKDIFLKGPYRKTAVYAPFRIAIALTDLLALAYLVYSFISHGAERSWSILIGICMVWIAAVTVQMLLVNTIINKVDRRPATAEETPKKYQKEEISWEPGTWVNILRLFLGLDIIFPEEMRKSADR
ncbi:MAG: hypothetical protein OEW04_00525 [Nitrospirota bacterium]|nr:hypothetical protein [Nitrospirota bacterium]